MPGKTVAMVTTPGWTPRGHFDLTERTSPVCVRASVPVMRPGWQSPQVCSAYKTVLFFSCCFAKEFLFCNVSSLKTERKAKTTLPTDFLHK